MQSIITFAGLAFANLAVAGPCKPLPQTTVSSVDVVSTTSAEPTIVTATLDPVSGVSTSADSTAISESETRYESSTYVESSTLATVVIQETSSAETSAAETSVADTTTIDTTVVETSAADTTAIETATVETSAADTSTAETSAAAGTTSVEVETSATQTTTAETTSVETSTADTTTADTTTVETTTEATSVETTTTDTTAADTTTVETTTEATSTEIETSATQTTTETAAPTADQSCDNGGMDYAIYTHQFYNSDPPRFTSFDATYFHDATPTYQGITERIGIQPNTDWTKPFKIYEDSPSQMYQYKAVNHRGFLYAPESGTYKVTVPNSDEITLVWFGDKAINWWIRENADLEQDYPGGTSRSFNIDLEAGTYTPFRLLWANAQGELNFIAEVQAPGGKVIVNGDGADNKYLVRFSCDGTTPTYPDF